MLQMILIATIAGLIYYSIFCSVVGELAMIDLFIGSLAGFGIGLACAGDLYDSE